MLFANAQFPPICLWNDHARSVNAHGEWHPAFEEVSAASDYALDGMARSCGTEPETTNDVDWSKAERHAYWLGWHLA